MADSLAGSEYTSIRERLRAAAAAKATPEGLAPLSGERKRRAQGERLSLSLHDYTELLEWTGRAARPTFPREPSPSRSAKPLAGRWSWRM